MSLGGVNDEGLDELLTECHIEDVAGPRGGCDAVRMSCRCLPGEAVRSARLIVDGFKSLLACRHSNIAIACPVRPLTLHAPRRSVRQWASCRCLGLIHTVLTLAAMCNGAMFSVIE